MQRRETMRFKVVGGVAGGIGVGLSPTNIVDFLRPGSPADAVLYMGDMVTHWNGVPLIDSTGAQTKLKDVVNTSLDEHIVTVERLLTPLSQAAKDELTEEVFRRTMPQAETPAPAAPSKPSTSWDGAQESWKPPSWGE